MARRRRADIEGRYFHAMNRGMSHRTVFERRAEIRFFLSRLAQAVRREEIEVLAFAIMTTHFHVLVRSRGGLSDAFRRIQSEFVSRFNRPRGRDGPLFRGRFHTKPVRTLIHLQNSFLYIHENPVQAGLAAVPAAYPWCSASGLSRPHPPPWLAVDLLERLKFARRGQDPSVAPSHIRRARADLVERRLTSSVEEGADELDDLLASPQAVRAWMHRNSRIADGIAPGLPLAGIQTVQHFVLEETPAKETIAVSRGPHRPLRLLMLAGLSRDLAGATYVEVGKLIGRSGSNAKRLIELHRECLRTDSAYADLATLIMARCLDCLRT